jgi:hypothetical protein
VVGLLGCTVFRHCINVTVAATKDELGVSGPIVGKRQHLTPAPFRLLHISGAPIVWHPIC